ncbi:efflux RND transporter periplasmic adaptor subunit [Paracoccus sp. PAR01]|uniref:efflux RND transporter periplasmic adaptor subunit n=1 Tax=Paracoccus sp. PAR01 TaxID=2769282 RepID=UPI001785E8D4|nr:efflux RND transporter periplasmic adaptor subunit [Paracoccus sp. PAR01]MBD9527018.1 efflux RND transporter periplasmic adaptor subunit [Paracoccus sp. PAR01]
MRRTFLGFRVMMLALLPVSAMAQATPAVIVAPAEMTEVRQNASFAGRVEATQKIDVRARVSGFLEEVAFKEGTRVEAGSLLYRIQDDDYRAAMTEIEGQIAAADAQRTLAALERDRKAELVRRKAVAQNELDIAQAQLGQAEGELQRLRGSLERQKLQLSYTQITAPFHGITGLTTVDVGALVGPDSGALTTLTLLDPIEVTFPVATSLVLTYQERIARGEVSKEAVALLTLANGAEYPIAGDVDYISANVAQGTDTVLVRARFDNPDGTLLDGALVRVMLEQRKGEQALTIPQQAVQRDQEGSFVLLVNAESKVERRLIKTGSTHLGRIVVTDGLVAGDRVITEGINKVRPGIAVDAATAPAAG